MTLEDTLTVKLVPSKKIQKNHLALDITGDLEGTVLTQGIPKMKHRDMFGLFYYAFTSESKNYKRLSLG